MFKPKNACYLYLLLGVIVSFFLGGLWRSEQYKDACLDLGGGSKPGDYPICVVPIPRNRYVYREGDEFVCDEAGNIFINAEQAQKYHKNPGAYGATYCQSFVPDPEPES
jgi:hypothetical protein